MTPPPPPQAPPPYYAPPPQSMPPYYAPTVPPVGPAPGVSYAGFWVRFVAYIIDGFILGLVVTLFYLVGIVVLAGGAAVNGSGNASLGAGAAIGLLVMLVGFIVGLAWKPWFWSHGGQTPAYKMLRLRVVRAYDGGPVGGGASVGRLIGYIINDIVFGIPLGFIWAALDTRKQGWHDKLAGTVVIQI